MTDTRFEKCTACNGTGAMGADRPAFGWASLGRVKCWTCRGTGMVERRPRFWMGAPA